MDIPFDAPSEVETGESFTVAIRLDSSDIYDVKVFVHESDDEKIAREEYTSEIEDDGWKDPWFYLPEAFPENKEYEVRVPKVSGDQTLCVRLRKTGSDTASTACKEISVKESEDNEEDEEEEKEENTKTASLEDPSDRPATVGSSPPQTLVFDHPSNEKVMLNAPVKKEDNEVIVSEDGRFRQAMLYGFIVLCVVIIVLLALKRL